MKRAYALLSLLLALILLLSAVTTGCSVAKPTEGTTGVTGTKTATETGTPTETTVQTAEPTTAGTTAQTTDPTIDIGVEPLKKTVPEDPYKPRPYEPVYDAEYEAVFQRELNTTSGAYLIEPPSRSGIAYLRRLPFAGSLDRAASREELIEIVNWHAFYRESGFSVELGFEATDVEEELNFLYRNSGYLPSLCAVFGTLENGVLTVNLKFYPETYLGSPRYTVQADYIGVENDPPTGVDTLPGLDLNHGVSVWDSDQATYALAKGYAISPIQGSPAESIIKTAKEILSKLIDDSMTEWQIAYRVYRWLMEHAVYDQEEHWAGGASLDKVYESEMYSARLISFKAEGPLRYGIGACFGFAKASALLLGLEGIDFTRVVAFSWQLNPGRSCILPSNNRSIAIHSFLYLHIGGLDYIFDPTAVGESCRSVYDNQTGKTVKISWYRDFCIGWTSKEHRSALQHYRDGDPYSNSDAYNPGMFNYLTEFTYDGEHDLLLSSPAEARHYYNYLLETVFSSGQRKLRTVTLFYNWTGLPEWNARYKQDLIDFLNATGVPYQYSESDISSNRSIANIQVMIVFGR